MHLVIVTSFSWCCFKYLYNDLEEIVSWDFLLQFSHQISFFPWATLKFCMVFEYNFEFAKIFQFEVDWTVSMTPLYRLPVEGFGSIYLHKIEYLMKFEKSAHQCQQWLCGAKALL